MAPPHFLQAQSSPVDWCEPNYAVSPAIAEFFNTTSNLAFVALPLLMYYLYNRGYARAFGRYALVIWPAYMLIGVASAYFHATLSFAGQLLDELSISYLTSAALYVFLPLPIRAGRCVNSVVLQLSAEALILNLRRLVLFSTVVFTIVAFQLAFVNVLALVINGAALLVLADQCRRRCGIPPALQRVFCRSVMITGVAFALWIVERTLCPTVGRLGTYLHALWHVLIMFALVDMSAVGMYLHANGSDLRFRPKLKYWPRRCGLYGLPYIGVEPTNYPTGSENLVTSSDITVTCHNRSPSDRCKPTSDHMLG